MSDQHEVAPAARSLHDVLSRRVSQLPLVVEPGSQWLVDMANDRPHLATGAQQLALQAVVWAQRRVGHPSPDDGSAFREAISGRSTGTTLRADRLRQLLGVALVSGVTSTLDEIAAIDVRRTADAEYLADLARLAALVWTDELVRGGQPLHGEQLATGTWLGLMRWRNDLITWVEARSHRDWISPVLARDLGPLTESTGGDAEVRPGAAQLRQWLETAG